MIGLNVQPLNVVSIDTTTLITKTVKTDSIRTDAIITRVISTDVLIGTYIDPVFGKTSVSFYTQLRLNTNNPQFGSNPQIDSVILSLMYDDSSYYGKSQSAQQNINVYRVTEDINGTNPYYSDDSLNYTTDLVASSFVGFVPVPKPMTQGTSFIQLRIPLDTALGGDILRHPSNLIDNSSFQNYLKGFYITTKNTTGLGSGEGNILRFKMEDINTKLTLYYHNDVISKDSFNFTFNSVARFSNFTHDYSIANPSLKLQLSNSSPMQNDVGFIQPMAGTMVKINMPYIKGWLNSGPIGINKAELVIKVNTSSAYQLDTSFAVPQQLVVYGINDDGSIYNLPDMNEGATYYGGTYDNLKYTFNIARYIQQILNGKLSNNGLYLRVLNDVINPNRLVIGSGGGNGNLDQMKLNIVRTKIP